MPRRKHKIQGLSVAAYERLNTHLQKNEGFNIYDEDDSRYFSVNSDKEACAIVEDLERAYKKFQQKHKECCSLYFISGNLTADDSPIVFLYADNKFDLARTRRVNRRFFRSNDFKEFKEFVKSKCPSEKQVKSPSNKSPSLEVKVSITPPLAAESKIAQQQSPRAVATTLQIQEELKRASPLPPLPSALPAALVAPVARAPIAASNVEPVTLLTSSHSAESSSRAFINRLSIYIPGSPKSASTQTTNPFFLYQALQAKLATDAQLYLEQKKFRRR